MLILQIGHSKLSPKASLVPVQLKGGTIISSFLILDLHHCCKMHNKLSVQTARHYHIDVMPKQQYPATLMRLQV